jgi:hypothetical protein
MHDVIAPIKVDYALLKRIVSIAPEKCRQVKMLYIGYNNIGQNEGTEVSVSYRFRNALWYTINGEKTFNTTFTPPNGLKKIELKVYGIEDVYTYHLLLQPNSININKIECLKVLK